MPRPPENRRSRSGGVALITVLWLVSLLTIIAAMTLTLTRTEDRLIHRSIDVVQAEVAADSAINLTILDLGTPRSQAQLSSGPDYARDVATFTDAVTVSVQRESDRVDLNGASQDMLTSCFASTGFSEQVARSMAARVADWRDPDDIPEPEGAESSEYRAAGLPYGPRNGPFQSVEELRRVLGLDHLSDSSLNLFTVYTHQTSDDAGTAAFEDAHGAATRKLACRGSQASRTSNPAGVRDSWIGEIARIRACSTHSAHVCRVAIVRLTGSLQAPFQIFAWRTEGG